MMTTGKPKWIVGQLARQKNGFWKTHRFLILRRFTQVAIILLFSMPIMGFWVLKGTLASSEFMGLIPLSDPFVFIQSLSAGKIYAASGLVGVLILTVAYWLLGGRSYCAWVCPINIITDAAHWLRTQAKFKNHVSLPRQSRFWIMIMVVVASYFSSSIAWELVNPITGLFRSLVYSSIHLSSIGLTLALIVFILDSIVGNRLWCSHLCPVGGFYRLLGTKTPLQVAAVAAQDCDDCADCYKVCPEFHVIKPVLKGDDHFISNADCTRCGRCIDICHANVFSFSWQIKRGSQKPL